MTEVLSKLVIRKMNTNFHFNNLFLGWRLLKPMLFQILVSKWDILNCKRYI